MKKIREITEEYNISRKDLFKLLEEKFWKTYSKNTTKIWDSIFEQIKKFLPKKKWAKSNKSNKWWNEKNILTFNDIEKIDFLAGALWISHKEQSKNKKETDFIKSNKNKNIEKTYKIEKKQDIKKTNKIIKKDETKDSLKTKDAKKTKIVVKKADKKDNKTQKFSKSDKKNVKNIPKKGKKELKISDTLKKKEKLIMWDSINIKELSEKIWIPVTDVIKKFILNWMPVSINSSVDFETVVLLADEFWVKVERKNNKSDISAIVEWNLKKIIEEKNSTVEKEELKERPPIVTIMWHVDHWKTKLLDYIRKTDFVSKESWWITQSIWASQITYNNKKITFIDTPWHELFTSMRARWAKITDIAIIVVAADEWVKQQTIEAINHAKDAEVNIIVAITKIDKPNANIEMCKSQLSEQWLIPEERWWEIPFVEVSSVTWEGINDLLEYILLQAELLELKYNPKAPAVWVVLEASKDVKNWTVATLLIMTWILRKKDPIVAYDISWKIRLIKDWTWKIIVEAKGWDPIQVMWFNDIPQSWRIFEVFPSEKDAQIQVQKISEIIKQTSQKTVLWSFLEKMKNEKNVELKVILKAWDFWGLEALKYAVNKIELPKDMTLRIVHSEVWHVKDSDIALAEASSAFIFWFDSWIASSLKKKLEQKKIIFKNFTIIYELLDYINKLAIGMIEKEQEEKYIGKLEVIAVFFKKWNDMIIWWKVIDWFIKNGSHFVLKRWEKELWWWKVTSLKIEKENVSEVKVWRECWIRVRSGKKVKEWDIIEFYVYEEE